MGDGLVQLLIFVALAAVFDAVTRSKKKGRTGQAEDEGDPPASTREGRPASRTGRTASPRGRSGSSAGTTAERERTPSDMGERETADSMVPEDLWAILTGQAPARRPDPVEDRKTSEVVVDPIEPWSRDTSPTERKPFDFERSESRGLADEAVGADRIGIRSGEIAPETSIPRVAPPEESLWAQGISRGARPVVATGAHRVRKPSTARKIGSLSRSARRSRRSTAASMLASELRGGGVDALRKAVILKEVLGPPLALRSSWGAPSDFE